MKQEDTISVYQVVFGLVNGQSVRLKTSCSQLDSLNHEKLRLSENKKQII